MTGFIKQNVVAVAVGFLTGILGQYLLAEPTLTNIITIAGCGYLGGHLPHIQQPSRPSYRLLRAVSWLACLLIPLKFFLYRPIQLVPVWIGVFLLTGYLWVIIDRISLQRDYTQSLTGIIALPLLVTGGVWLALGTTLIVPVFLACSTGYITQLFIEQYPGRGWLGT